MNNFKILHLDIRLMTKFPLFFLLVIPQITPFDFGDEPINFGDSTSLTCSVHKGDLPINLSWLHNNISIGYMQGVVLSIVGKKSSFLTIDSVTDKHSGKYTCIAENKAGTASYSTILNVNGIILIINYSYHYFLVVFVLLPTFSLAL